jgi:hypothetical protein
VERAQTGEILPGTAQFHSLADQFNDINARFDLINLGHGVDEL